MIRFFASHPTAANLIMIGLIAVGLAAAPEVKRETFPDIPAEAVEIRVPYPGASAEEVETALCLRIEDALDGIDNRQETRCEAREGLAIATAEIREGAPMDRFLEDVKSEIEAIDSFPDDAERPVIKELGRTYFVASVAITGPRSAPDLKAYAEAVKARLLQIPGVSRIRVEGFSDHQIRIEVPAETLLQFGLSVDDLADIVRRQSTDLPGGTIETKNQTVLIRFADERRSPLAFEDLIVVAGESGAEIRLGDIALITDRFERDEVKSLFNGKRAAYLVIEKTKGEDTLDVVDALYRGLERERATAPPGMAFAVTKDISSIVRDRLNMLLRNGAQGLVLVFLTMWGFFSLRYSFWVSMGLPVSFLGAIAVMAMTGYSFDMISMVALLIAVGLLMDDAIVISENIAAHRQRGKTPVAAAIDGARQVMPGVIASFLTTILIFGALAFMKGHMGAVLKVLPVILIVVLSVSLIEAFLVLPFHLSHALGGTGRETKTALRLRIEHGIDHLRENIIGPAVDKAIEWRYLTVGLVLALFLVSVSMVSGGALKFRAFPELEGNVMEARILLPQGTPLKRTEDVVASITGALEKLNAEFAPRQPKGLSLVKNIGIEYNVNADAFETGSNVATVSVDLLKSDLRDAPIDEVIKRWRGLVGTLPDVIGLKFAKPRIGPAGRAIDLRLMGADLDRLKAASLALQVWLNGYPGVLDLSDDLRPGKPEARLRLRPGAGALGLNAKDIAGQLQAAFQGRKTDEIQVGTESYEIDVRLAKSDRDSLADLDYFTVTAPGGEQAPLGTVAVIEPGRGYARINRVDGLRTVTIQGEVDTKKTNVGEILKDTRLRFLPKLLRDYPDIKTSFQGQAKETSKTASSMMRNFSIGILGVFLILSFQFKSYIEPLIVMSVIPLALIGAVWGHLLLGFDFSMPSMVGLISLVGIVVNDSILLVRFIKIRRAEGETVINAARMAARQRFRAILLTSLTTVAGLLPLLTETSLQAQVLQPLVASLAFGLFGATALVLFVVPSLYAILDDFGLTSTVVVAGKK